MKKQIEDSQTNEVLPEIKDSPEREQLRRLNRSQQKELVQKNKQLENLNLKLDETSTGIKDIKNKMQNLEKQMEEYKTKVDAKKAAEPKRNLNSKGLDIRRIRAEEVAHRRTYTNQLDMNYLGKYLLKQNLTEIDKTIAQTPRDKLGTEDYRRSPFGYQDLRTNYSRESSGFKQKRSALQKEFLKIQSNLFLDLDLFVHFGMIKIYPDLLKF